MTSSATPLHSLHNSPLLAPGQAHEVTPPDTVQVPPFSQAHVSHRLPFRGPLHVHFEVINPMSPPVPEHVIAFRAVHAIGCTRAKYRTEQVKTHVTTSRGMSRTLQC